MLRKIKVYRSDLIIISIGLLGIGYCIYLSVQNYFLISY